MTWALLLPIIAEKGIPFAFDLWKIISTHPEPNDAAWEALLKLNEKTYDQYISEAQAAKDAAAKSGAGSGA